MPRRPATVTQADIARALRAARQEGVAVRRIVVRGDGVSIELGDGPADSADQAAAVEPVRDFAL